MRKDPTLSRHCHWIGGSVAALLLLCLGVSSAGAAEIRVLSAGAVKEAETALGADFAQATGDQPVFTFGTVGAIEAKLNSGETADVVILSAPAIAAMAKSGALLPGSAVALGRVGIGVAVKRGAPHPDIATTAALRRTLLAAPSIVYANPAKGASSGIYLAQLFRKMGIAEAVSRKAILEPGGYVVVDVANGKAALGIHNISEILPVKGVELVGPLPAAVQHYTVYSAGVIAKSAAAAPARAFVAFLAGPKAQARWRQAGVDPARAGGK